MSRQPPSLKTVLSEIAKADDRSSLFWWMVEHHDEVVTAANGRRMQWRRLCVRFAELGLTDRTGKPATEKIARLTWFRARQEVVRVRELSAAAPSQPGAVFPSRMPKDWKPADYREPSAPQPPVASSQMVPSGARSATPGWAWDVDHGKAHGATPPRSQAAIGRSEARGP